MNKKYRRQDFRQEAVNLIRKINLSDEKLSQKLSLTFNHRVSFRTIMRWRKGETSPDENEIEYLRKVSQGLTADLPLSIGSRQASYDLRDEFKKLEGKMEMWMSSFDKKFANLADQLKELTKGSKRS